MFKSLNIYNTETYKEIFNQFYKPLVIFAASKVKSTETAEDLVQDIFISLWNKKLKFEDNISLKTYLYRSVLNRCINYIRDSKSKEKYLQSLTDATITEQNTLMNEIIRADVYSILISAVNTLPPRCKEIFQMAQEGMSCIEIGEKLGITAETVKKQRKIALKMLRKELGPCMFMLFIFKGKIKKLK